MGVWCTTWNVIDFQNELETFIMLIAEQNGCYFADDSFSTNFCILRDQVLFCWYVYVNI